MDAICQHASDALTGPYDRLRDWVLGQAALHVDETGWRTAGDSLALWAATTADASLFQIAEHCNRERFDELIGAFSGIIVSDRWPGYEHLRTSGRSAGRTCSATSVATQKDSPSRTASASADLS